MKKKTAKKTPKKQAPKVVHQGWQCPKCNVVHAPSVKDCRCVAGALDDKWRIPITPQTPDTRNEEYKEWIRRQGGMARPFIPYHTHQYLPSPIHPYPFDNGVWC